MANRLRERCMVKDVFDSPFCDSMEKMESRDNNRKCEALVKKNKQYDWQCTRYIRQIFAKEM